MNKVVKMLDYNAWLGISATPATNDAKDYLGYAEVIWDGRFPFGYNHLVESIRAADFYNPKAWENLKQGLD